MKVISTTPLHIFENVDFFKEPFIFQIGKYKCKIMSCRAGLDIDVIDVVEWKGHMWGIKPDNTMPQKYNYLAIKV